MVRRQFWNQVYESRYESLMRNQKWPPLKVSFLNAIIVLKYFIFINRKSNILIVIIFY